MRELTGRDIVRMFAFWIIVLAAMAAYDAAADAPPKLDPAAAVRILLLQYDVRVAQLTAENGRARLPCLKDEEQVKALREEIALTYRLSMVLSAKLDQVIAAAAIAAKLDPDRWRPDVGAMTWRRVSE